MIVIVNYRMGNVGSILNMFKKIGVAASISSDPKDIDAADKLVLPGVGAFDSGMGQLEAMGLLNVLNEKVINAGTPVLGICLGMQLMTRGSEEGKRHGLGWIDAQTVRFNHGTDTQLKVPHMGWNSVFVKKESALFKDTLPETRFYFVHSYHVVCHKSSDILTTTRYGTEFVSSFQKGNIMGVQFHPEKSHKFGIRLLRNFAEIN